MAHPTEVSKRGVPVSSTTQREGEFVLTFPQVRSVYIRFVPKTEKKTKLKLPQQQENIGKNAQNKKKPNLICHWAKFA